MRWHQLDRRCKQSAPRSRQITAPTPHRSVFTGRMLFLTPNQQCQSTEGQHARTHASEIFLPLPAQGLCYGNASVCLSVRSSVCTVRRQLHRRAAGLLLWARRPGDIDLHGLQCFDAVLRSTVIISLHFVFVIMLCAKKICK